MKMKHPIRTWRDNAVIAEPVIDCSPIASDGVKLGLAVAAHIENQAKAFPSLEEPPMAYLTWADLRGAILDGLNLLNASFSWVDLTGASLRGADLRGSCFAYADLVDADLTDALFDFHAFGLADLRGAIFDASKIDTSSCKISCGHPYRKRDVVTLPAAATAA